MNGEGHRAPELAARVETRFQERQIPSAMSATERLIAQGLVVETRQYLVIRRGLASLGLYISTFGRDMFISMVSYLKPPVSNVRLAVVGLMLLFQFYTVFVLPNSLGQVVGGFSPFGGSSSGNAFFQLCLLVPLGIVNSLLLLILLCYSVYKWLTEKDFAAAVRVQPNEFNEDDLMAMEKVVEETVRQSLTELKLNPDDLKLAAPGTAGTGRQLF